ncbi:MAG TPA: hypothetical protein VF268_15680 [Gammaproteobacteria bacterium]
MKGHIVVKTQFGEFLNVVEYLVLAAAVRINGETVEYNYDASKKLIIITTKADLPISLIM